MPLVLLANKARKASKVRRVNKVSKALRAKPVLLVCPPTRFG